MSNEVRTLEDVELPAGVARALQAFLESAREVLGSDLRAVVLYGSAADGRMRPTSDVNLVLVLSRFDGEKAGRLRDPLRTAVAAIRLEAMFLLADEIPSAMDAFAVKFADILRRRRVLLGDDPFAGMKLSRAAEIARLRQVLLNLVLRLRQRYLVQSLRDEQAGRLLADAAGPLRAAAASLLELQGKPVAGDAVAAVARAIPGSWDDVLALMGDARERRELPPRAAAEALLLVIDLTTAMRGLAAGVTS